MHGRTLGDEKAKFLQVAYNTRVESLSQRVEDFLGSIAEDEVFTAMQGNPLSKQFAASHASEMLTECLKDEREETISALQEELVEFKANYVKLECEMASLCESKVLEGQMSAELGTLRSDNLMLSRKLIEKKEVIQSTTGNSERIEELRAKVQGEKEKSVELEILNEKLQRRFKDSVEVCDKQENKVRLLKKKVLQQKQKITELSEEHNNLVATHREMALSLKNTLEHTEKEAKNKEKQLKQTQQEEVADLKEQHRRSLHEKIERMQREMDRASSEHEDILCRKTTEYTENYLRKAEHNRVLKELEGKCSQESSILKSQLANLEALLDSAKSDNLQLKDSSVALKQSYEELQEDSQEKSKQITGLESQKEEILLELEMAGNALGELKSSYRAEHEEKEHSLIENKKLSSRLHDAEEQSEHLHSVIKNLKAKHSQELDNLIAHPRASANDSQLQAQLAEQTEIIRELQGKATLREEDQNARSSLENQLQQKGRTIQTLKQQLEEQFSEQNAKLKENTQKATNALKAQIQSLETESTGKNQIIQDLESETTRLSNSLKQQTQSSSKNTELRRSRDAERSRNQRLLRQINQRVLSGLHVLRSSLLSLTESYQHASFTYRTSLQTLGQDISFKLLSLSRSPWASQELFTGKTKPEDKLSLQDLEPGAVKLQLERSLRENAELRRNLTGDTSKSLCSSQSQHNKLKINHLKHRVTELKLELNGQREMKNQVKNSKLKGHEEIERTKVGFKEEIGALKERLHEKEERNTKLRYELETQHRRMDDVQKTLISEFNMMKERIKELESQVCEEKAQNESLVQAKSSDLQRVKAKLRTYKEAGRGSDDKRPKKKDKAQGKRDPQ